MLEHQHVWMKSTHKDNLDHRRPVDITKSNTQTSANVSQINKAARNANRNFVVLLRFLMVGMPSTVVLVAICRVAPVSQYVFVRRSLMSVCQAV